MRLLLADNRDSFTFNLAHALGSLGAEVLVEAAEGLPGRWQALDARAVVLGPGPGRPEKLPALRTLTAEVLAADVPVLGVCLGHQALAHHAGARIERARRPLHGHTSAVRHDARDLFAGLPQPLRCMRYHSLRVAARSLADTPLQATAWSPEDEVMGICWPGRPVWSVQFHPESFLSEGGSRLLDNWLRLVAEGRVAAPLPPSASGAMLRAP